MACAAGRETSIILWSMLLSDREFLGFAVGNADVDARCFRSAGLDAVEVEISCVRIIVSGNIDDPCHDASAREIESEVIWP